jgi:hypothetical protein
MRNDSKVKNTLQDYLARAFKMKNVSLLKYFMKLKFLNIIKESFYLKKIYHGSFRKKLVC